ncbi:hypothetical protein [Aureimonas sp. AU20]|uniref:hypothetical protein n=1 Tax=Aureimonas sp. AU20 TaxID=1349819 RepID=UPI0007860596|nr:hypothetical protein [Aureimonas sp. AU20]
MEPEADEPPVPTSERSAPESDGDARSPLQVRSFASAIQSRRTTPLPVPPVAAPTPPAPQVEASVAPQAETPRPIEPAISVAPAPRPPEPAAVAAAPSVEKEAKADQSERPMTLEEEMERLLHDFTLDVSDRR